MPKPMTIIEKVLARAAGVPEVTPGQVITAKVGLVYTMDTTGKVVFDHLKSIGVKRISDPEKVVVVFGQCIPPTTVQYANLQNDIRRLAREFGIRVFDAGNHGIMHQLVGEEGYLVPGMVAVGTDAHALTGGALGAVVLGVGATDAAVAIATGELWLRVPANVRIELSGKLPVGTMARDIMVHLMGQKGWDGTRAEWGYRALELTGEAVEAMGMDSRLSLCNLATDTGAKTAIVPPDRITLDYIAGNARRSFDTFASDAGAVYAEHLALDVSGMEPQVACPHSPDNVRPLSQVVGKRINVATIATCTNGRLEDLHVAAQILRGRRVHPDVRMTVAPASQRIYVEAVEDGTFSVLAKAGALIGPSSCGPCLGGQLVILGDGDVCAGTVPRNMAGRMGSSTAEIYSVNPAVVAASAIKGELSDPREFLETRRPV